MDWEEAIAEAKEGLGITGWCSPKLWDEAVERAKDILREEASRIATWKHKEYLLSPEWKKKREKVLQRDNYLCQDCLKLIPEIFAKFFNIKFEPFNYSVRADDVHHLDYSYKQTIDEEKFCISLCKLHHELHHCFVSHGRTWLKEKIEDNIYLGIYYRILMQPKIIEEIKRQHESFLKSITINYKKIRESDFHEGK